MAIIEHLLIFTKNFFAPLGALGLFLLAFVEASFFPIPPDALLIPLALLNPSLAFYYAALATIGSVAGAFLGYYIGKKGRLIVKKFVKQKSLKKAEKIFKEYGSLAVGISAFTPIPYKIFTITSGILKLNLVKFFFASLIGRAARFFLEAIIILFYGKQILELFTSLEVITLTIAGLILVIFLVYRKFFKY